MSFKLLTLRESAEWSHLLENLIPRFRDVFLSPTFYKLFEEKKEGAAHCFVYSQGTDYGLYPFLLNEIDPIKFNLEKTYYDIQPAYGYNGVLATSQSPEFLNAFSEEFQIYCKENDIVAELVRFNPILQNETFMPHIKVHDVLDNISIRLDQGYPSIWMNSYEGKVRKAVRKAESYNLVFQYFLGHDLPPEKLEWFKALYNDTMRRNNANHYYYFNNEFFHKLVAELPANSIVVFVLLDGKPVSTQLVLFGETVAYGYLGGTSAETYPVSPNVYLFHKLLPLLIDMGLKNYSMGGGLSRHDSLYKYKKSFNKMDEPQHIYIGSKVHNEEIYTKIVTQWENTCPSLVDKYQNYVLKYRYSQ